MSDFEKLAHSERCTLGTIEVYTKDGSFVDSYKSMKLLCSELDLHQAAIDRTLKGKQKQHKGYIFKRIIKENP